MSLMKLPSVFYKREDVTAVARELLGKTLYTKVGNKITAGKIVETEAYSYRERACHAFNNKKTKRTNVLFMEGGTSYVYLCYGIHKLFNIVTNEENVAEAVLVRAVEPLEGIACMFERRGDLKPQQLTSGPGKLSEAMGIDLSHNKLSLLDGKIWVEDDRLALNKIETTPRIGVGYAKEDALLPWRFIESGNPYVSKGNTNY